MLMCALTLLPVIVYVFTSAEMSQVAKARLQHCGLNTAQNEPLSALIHCTLFIKEWYSVFDNRYSIIKHNTQVHQNFLTLLSTWPSPKGFNRLLVLNSQNRWLSFGEKTANAYNAIIYSSSRQNWSHLDSLPRHADVCSRSVDVQLRSMIKAWSVIYQQDHWWLNYSIPQLPSSAPSTMAFTPRS